MKIKILSFFIFIVLISCKEHLQPKPEGDVRLEYPTPVYDSFQSDCPFTFEYNTFAKIEKDSSCWYTVAYPNMKAKLYLTYYPSSKNNLADYIKQSEKLVYEHTIKASGIEPKIYINDKYKVYGTFYELMGESATNFQFYLTDSSDHFLAGSFYFRAQPKPDSLLPAVEYIRADLKHLMETTEFK